MCTQLKILPLFWTPWSANEAYGQLLCSIGNESQIMLLTHIDNYNQSYEFPIVLHLSKESMDLKIRALKKF